jgi:hypothetical protein
MTGEPKASQSPSECKQITDFAITILIQDSKESRGRQMLKEDNIIFTLER